MLFEAARRDAAWADDSTRAQQARHAVHVEVLRSLDEIERVRGEWDRLWAEDADADLFGTSAWFLTWWQHFGKGEQPVALVLHERFEPCAIPGGNWRLHVIVARADNGAAIAVLPLVYIDGSYRGRACRILSTPLNNHSPRCGLTSTRWAGDVVSAIARVLHKDRSWDLLLLGGLPAHAARARALADALRACGLRCVRGAECGHAYLRFSGTWESFLAGKRRQFRNRLERAERDLRRLGEVSVEVYTGADASRRGMKIFDAVERASWKARCGELLAADPKIRAFYSAVCSGVAEVWQSQVWVLRIGGHYAAAYICLSDGRSVYTLKTSFSESYRSARHSPSHVLLGHIIRNCWNGGARGIDFASKLLLVDRWANDEITHEHALYYRSTALGLRLQAARWTDATQRNIRAAGERLKRVLRRARTPGRVAE